MRTQHWLLVIIATVLIWCMVAPTQADYDACMKIQSEDICNNPNYQ